jgi:hypothetical protein
MDTTANGLPSDIVFPDGDYASSVVSGSTTDKWVYINNSIITSNKTTRFTVLQRMEVDLLLVGGGGAGGHNVGGGGGGGGIFYGKNIILEAGNYKIVVGRGGIGQTGLFDGVKQGVADGVGVGVGDAHGSELVFDAVGVLVNVGVVPIVAVGVGVGKLIQEQSYFAKPS